MINICEIKLLSKYMAQSFRSVYDDGFDTKYEDFDKWYAEWRKVYKQDDYKMPEQNPDYEQLIQARIKKYNDMENKVKDLTKHVEEQQKIIEDLKIQVEQLQSKHSN
jgi:phage shock protein A